MLHISYTIGSFHVKSTKFLKNFDFAKKKIEDRQTCIVMKAKKIKQRLLTLSANSY